MPKHTPGPWHVSRGTNDVVAGTKHICIASLGVPVGQADLEARLETMRANAQLIAAAPELLDVCIRWSEITKGRVFRGGPEPMVSEELNFLKELCDDAIAKATGKTEETR